MSQSPLENLLNQPFFTPIELAAILRVNKITIYRRLKEGRIPGRVVDGRWLTNRAELLKYLKENYGTME